MSTQTDETILLPARIRLPQAEELLARLRDIPPDRPVTLAAAEVEELGTPAVIALVSALSVREALTPPMIVHGASEAFVEAFTDLGAFSHMMKMEFRA
ncbi:MAG: hypothetical protein ACPGID_10130 [Rubricella sp.]